MNQLKINLILKRCPFCGGEATISDCLNWGQHTPYIECLQCAASSNMAGTLEEVTEFWNRRAYEDFFEEIKNHADNGHKTLSVKWLLAQINVLKELHEPI